VSGETIPVVKEARVELTLGRRTLRIWVFVADITDDFMLGLDRYPAGLRRVSGRGTPCATTGPRRGASERRAYSVGVNAVTAYRKSYEQAAGMLAKRWHRSSQERVTTEACQGGGKRDWRDCVTGEATPVGRWQSRHCCLMRSNGWTGVP
jgi:hypothetical protein